MTSKKKLKYASKSEEIMISVVSENGGNGGIEGVLDCFEVFDDIYRRK